MINPRAIWRPIDYDDQLFDISKTMTLFSLTVIPVPLNTILVYQGRQNSFLILMSHMIDSIDD